MCNCPRCKDRTIGEVIGEFFRAVREGVDRVNPDIKVFDYSWDGDDLETRYDVIDHLPERVGVESICESGISYEIAGVKSTLSDYSLNIIGPGEFGICEKVINCDYLLEKYWCSHLFKKRKNVIEIM